MLLVVESCAGPAPQDAVRTKLCLLTRFDFSVFGQPVDWPRLREPHTAGLINSTDTEQAPSVGRPDKIRLEDAKISAVDVPLALSKAQ